MFKQRKITACILSIIMIFALAATAFAHDLDGYADRNVYDMLEIHYTILTGLEADVADTYYEEISNNGFTNEQLDSIDKVLYPGNLDSLSATYDKLAYLQDNYSELTSYMPQDKKILIDKYIMYLGLLYYYENPRQSEYLKMNEMDESIQRNQVGKAAANIVGKLTIFADTSTRGVGSSGHEINLGKHAWISFENTSSGYQRLGGLDYYQGTGGTVGTYGNLPETNNYKGVHYNVESVKVNDHSMYSPRYSLSVQITADDLSRINQTITYNDTWTKVNNCSWFAAAVWNASGGKYVSAGVIPTPKTLADNIKKISGYDTNAEVPYCDITYYKAKNPVKFTL